MGYTLKAFITTCETAALFANEYDKCVLVDIGQNITLIPMTDELFDQINDFKNSDDIAQFEFLTEGMESKILRSIKGARIAYVEADYFGGNGGQMAIVWNGNRREWMSVFGQGKINEALRRFGVKCNGNRDEFSALGLDRYRQTDQWIEDF